MSTRAPRDPRSPKSAIRKRLAFERKNLDYLTEHHSKAAVARKIDGGLAAARKTE